MPITKFTLLHPIRKILRAIGANKAIAWSDEIMNAPTGSDTGPSVMEALEDKLEPSDVLSVSADLPVAGATSRAFHYRTDERELYVLQVTGSPAQYSWVGPFDVGDASAAVIYSSEDDPSEPVLTYNALNKDLNFGGSAWSRTRAGAKWQRVIIEPANSNVLTISHNIRIGDPTAGDIAYTRPNRDGNLPSSVNNVQELGDAFHDYTPPAPAPVEPTGEEQIGELTSGWVYSHPISPLFDTGYTGYHTFSVDNNLRNLVTTYGTTLSISVAASITTQSGTDGRITLSFGVADNSNNFLFSNNFTIVSVNARTTGTVKVFGNLPPDFTSGRFLVRVVSNTGTPTRLIAGFNSIKFRIEPDEDASSVPVDRTQFGDILPSDDASLATAQDAFEVIDELPMQVSDTYDIEFPAGPNGIDDNSTWVVRRLPLERFLQIRNERPQQTFIGKIQYNSAYIAGSQTPPLQPNPNTVTFTFRVWSNLPDTISNADLEARTYLEQRIINNQPAETAQQNLELLIPNDCMEIAVGFKSDTGQNDARLLITNFDFDIELGLDSSGFSGNLNDEIHSVQSFANAYDSATLGGGGASTAAGVSVDNTQFDNPQTDPGGLRDQSLAITNAQQVFNVIDDLNQALEDPFKVNQVLDFGGTFTNAGTINSGTALRTNDIDIDSDLRALSADVAVRVKIRVNAITSNFRGNISLIDGDNPSTRYGDLHPVNGSGVTAVAANDFIILQRVIPAAQVPTTAQVQWNRTSSAGSATFDRGKAYMVIFPAGQTGGQGQSVSYTEVIIWTAGLTTTARLTNSNVQTLLGTNTWGQYQRLQFNFDNGTDDGQLFPMTVLSSQFRASANYGTFTFSDFYGYNVIPHGSGDNQFRFIWNGAGTKGLRRIIGTRVS